MRSKAQLPAVPPPLPPPHSFGQKVKDQNESWIQWLGVTALVLFLLGCGALSLVFLGLIVGPAQLGVAMIFALLPVPLYAAAILWVDRIEKEPTWMLLTAFAWGATAAIFFALVFNTLFGVLTIAVSGPEVANLSGPVIVAPIVEELGKGLVLLLLYWWNRTEIHGIVDGIVYASMVALGFAMVENILYYGKAMAEGGTPALTAVFVLRGILTAFAHPVFTSFIGIGFGIAANSKSASVKFFLPLSGFIAAVVTHAIWNFVATQFVGGYSLIVNPLLMLVGLGFLLGLIYYSLEEEKVLLRHYLQPEKNNGLLNEVEFNSICSIFTRIGTKLSILFSQGWAAYRAIRLLHDVAAELAFYRYRVCEGTAEGDSVTIATVEREYMDNLETAVHHWRQFSSIPHPATGSAGHGSDPS